MSAIRLEEPIGVITCVIEKIDRRTGSARFSLPHLPVAAGTAPDKHRIAAALGIEPEDIGFGIHHPSVFSAGVIFYLIPVKGPAVLTRMKPDGRGWTDVFPLGHGSVYVYCETPDEQDNDYAARMFSPGMGLGEDPATGAAAAALIGQLAPDAPGGQSEYRLRQGHEMGRPSLITMQIRKDGDTLIHGGIGGSAVIVGQGSLDLYD
jgi:trans-2,3-dihydro-3-hydroxyanthranilate isomerase